MLEIKKIATMLLILLALTWGQALAQPHLHGNISGTLGPGDYIVDGDCNIQYGAVVTIQPGTTFLHAGAYTWTIFGTLHANGTQTDSIRFVRQSTSVEAWGGLRYTPTMPVQNNLDYCVIDQAYHGGTAEILGGGIYLVGNYLTVNHCRIIHCQVAHDGAGIYAYYATLMVVQNSVIDSNTADIGGGIYLNMCSGAQIKNCTISRNRSTGT